LLKKTNSKIIKRRKIVKTKLLTCKAANSSRRNMADRYINKNSIGPRRRLGLTSDVGINGKIWHKW